MPQEVLCTAKDCPIFYRRRKAHKDLIESQKQLEVFVHTICIFFHQRMTVIMIAYNFMIMVSVCSAEYLRMCAAIFDQLVNWAQNGIRYGFIRFPEGSSSFFGPFPCYPAPLVL
jgi:hypothetical protein